MSVETAVSQKEARRHAEEAVRYELGTFLRLGEGRYEKDENTFKFPITIRSPRIITDGQNKDVVDVRYFSEVQVGTITVDGHSKEVERPNRSTIKRRVREHENEIELAVQKALVGAAGRKFSHLPFPENQFSPLEDILSELILEGEMNFEKIELMDENRSNDRYKEYLEQLIELDLAKQDDQLITNGSILIKIIQETQEDPERSHQDALNSAMGYYFESHLGEFKMIKRTLGPYLAIAGRYYHRALELEEMPVIHEDELRDAIRDEYSGRKREQRLMKLSRYLIQLEGVGILESVQQNGTRFWTGKESIRENILEQKEYLAPYQSLIA